MEIKFKVKTKEEPHKVFMRLLIYLTNIPKTQRKKQDIKISIIKGVVSSSFLLTLLGMVVVGEKDDVEVLKLPI